MFETDQEQMPSARLRTLQIIVAAMAAGVAIFLVVVLVLPADSADAASDVASAADKPPIITYIALAYGAAALFAGPLISMVVTTAGRRKITGTSSQPGTPTPAIASPDHKPAQSRTDKLVVLFMTKTIIGTAVYEAAGLFLGVAYMLDHQTPSAILAAVLAVGILAQMPTSDRARQWMEGQLCQIEQAGQL